MNKDEVLRMPTHIKNGLASAGDIELFADEAIALINSLTSENERLQAESERAFTILLSEGVTRERAKSLANGIDVLATRCRKRAHLDEAEIHDLRQKVAELEAEHQHAKEALSAYGLDDEKSLHQNIVGMSIKLQQELSALRQHVPQYRPISECPRDNKFYLFETAKGIPRVDRFHPTEQHLSSASGRWQELPADRYVKWMPLPTPQETKE